MYVFTASSSSARTSSNELPCTARSKSRQRASHQSPPRRATQRYSRTPGAWVRGPEELSRLSSINETSAIELRKDYKCYIRGRPCRFNEASASELRKKANGFHPAWP